MVKSLLLLLAAVAATATAAAHVATAAGGCTRYAAPTGDDTAAGTAAHPFKTVGRLIQAVPAGGVACLKSGGTFSSRAVISKAVALRASGTAHATLLGGITIEQGADGASVSGLTIHGRGAGRATILVQANGVHIVGNAIDGTGYVDKNTACVLVDGARNVVIGSDEITTCTKATRSGLSAPGVFVGSGYATRISNDLITHISGYGIVLGPNAQHTHVTNTIVDGASGGVLLNGNGQTASSYNVIENSILSNLGGHAVLAEWPGLTGTHNGVFSTCVWRTFGGTISAPGVAASGNKVANPQYKDRPTDYTITGGPCISKRPSIVGVHLSALPKFVVEYSLLGLPTKVRMDVLTVDGVSAGDSVAAVCTRLCSGSFKTIAKGSTVTLGIVKHKWVKVGATIDVRVTRPGYAGAWARITVTGVPHGVSIVHACLQPGSNVPVSCGAFG